MTLTEALAAAVIVMAVPLNWAIALLLVGLARESSGAPVLRAAAVSWVSLAVIVTVFAFVFANNSMHDPFLDTVQTQLLTRITLLVFSIVPAVYWIRTVWRRR